MDKESESAVIRDWLTQAGGAVDDPTPWIESISEQTHGWPQHIISYVKPAEEYLNSNHHRMTDKGLESILKQCAESRKDYYKKRAKGIDRKKRVSLARKFANVPVGKTMEHEDIISALAKEYSEEESGKLFKEALERESLMIGTTETMMFRFLPFTCGSSIATGKTGAKVVCSQWNDSLTLNRDIWTAFTKRTLI